MDAGHKDTCIEGQDRFMRTRKWAQFAVASTCMVHDPSEDAEDACHRQMIRGGPRVIFLKPVLIDVSSTTRSWYSSRSFSSRQDAVSHLRRSLLAMAPVWPPEAGRCPAHPETGFDLLRDAPVLSSKWSSLSCALTSCTETSTTLIQSGSTDPRLQLPRTGKPVS